MDYIEISILDAAMYCNIAFDYNSSKEEVDAACPFCDDRKKHLSLNKDKNQFRCNRCGESGNSITLYAKIFNVDNKTAYKELVQDSINKPTHTKKANPIRYEIRPLADRHDVYYDLLEMLSLSSKHKENLTNRGLDDSIIDRNMYRSMPEKYENQLDIAYSLSKRHDLEGIPGFYYKHSKWRFVLCKGLFIPICDYKGYIQGFQIRHDNDSAHRYTWFSSRSYNGGTGAKSWIHMANWNNSKTVYITEGALKAEVASYLMGNVCIVGLSGVNCTNGLLELLHKLNVSEVIESFDMDKVTNTNVSGAVSALKEKLKGEGISCRSATWNPVYKGIDDFYLAVTGKNSIAA